MPVKLISILMLGSSVMIAGVASAEQQASVADEPAVTFSTDPVSADLESNLRASGIIAKQSELGSQALIMRQESQRLQAFQELVNILGLKPALQLYPDLEPLITDSQIALEAQLRRATTESSIAKIGVPEPAKAPGAQILDSTSGPTGQAQIRAPEGISPQEVDARIKAALAEANRQSEPAARTQRLSLREVYGHNGELTAIIQLGEQKIRLKQGDTLPGERVVSLIEGNRIVVTEGNGDERSYSLAD